MQTGKHGKQVFANQYTKDQVATLTIKATEEHFAFSVGREKTVLGRSYSLLDERVREKVTFIDTWIDNHMDLVKKNGVSTSAGSDLVSIKDLNMETIQEALGKKAKAPSKNANKLTDQQQAQQDNLEEEKSKLDERKEQ